MSKRLGTIFASGFLLGVAAMVGARKKPGPDSPPVPEPPKKQGVRRHPIDDYAGRLRSDARSDASPQQPHDEEPGYMTPPPTPPEVKAPSAGRLALYAALLAAVALAAIAAWIAWSETSSALLAPAANQPSTAATPMPPPPQAAKPAPQYSAACPTLPLVEAANQKDGKFPQHADVSGLIEADILSFAVLGKDSAADGRPRDAEAAFLMSCRVADALKGADSVETADAKYQLGSHYVRVAMNQQAGARANRNQLLKQAELLYSDSLRSYSANYGEGHEKTRLASEGLAQLRQTLAQGQGQAQIQAQTQITQPAPETPPASTAASAKPVAVPNKATPESSTSAGAKTVPPQSRQATTQVAKAAPLRQPKPETPAQPWPSPNCNRAPSIPETIICSDAELSQQDRELGRLYVRAKIAASDSAAFQRQQDDEWRMRESICRDRECLIRWYGQRRMQLLAVITGRS